MREEPRFVVNYVTTAGEHIDQDEHDWMPPAIGMGVQFENGDRYRVVDVWSVKAKRGRPEYGVHAFLEPVTAETDRLGNTWPEYYRT